MSVYLVYIIGWGKKELIKIFKDYDDAIEFSKEKKAENISFEYEIENWSLQ